MAGLGKVLLLCVAAAVGCKAWAQDEAPLPRPSVSLHSGPASAHVLRLVSWVLVSGDTAGRPFAVVDKQGARLWVFAADGQVSGSAPALLGQARGDDAAVGAGLRGPSRLLAHERTTPAGRFDSEPGRNDKGEAVVWIDYDAALAIHRLRPAPAAEQRPQRLASPSAADNRISLGCVIVSAEFYDQVVAPTLGRHKGVVYVLPENRSLSETFGSMQAAAL